MNIYEKLFEIKKAGIKLQRDTKAYNYKYATLDQIQKKLNGEFEKQKLLIVHTILDNKVRTSIIDIEAKENEPQSMISEIELTEGIKPQDKGSEITYYRRYNLLSLLDLEVEDDDGKKAQESSKTSAKEDNKEWFNDENYDKLVDLLAEGKIFTLSDIRNKYKISRANAEKLKNIGIN